MTRNIFLISFNYFIIGLLSLAGVAFTLFYKESVTLAPAELISLGMWTSLPWTIKIVFGSIIDSFLKSRKPYSYLGSLFLFLGYQGFSNLHLLTTFLTEWQALLFLGFLVQLGVVLVDIVTDTFQVEAVDKSQYEKVQYWSQVFQTLGLVVGAVFTGILASKFPFQSVIGSVSFLAFPLVWSTALINVMSRELPHVNWKFLAQALSIIPFFFFVSDFWLVLVMTIYVGWFIYKVCPLNKYFLLTMFGIFLFRVYPSVGPSGTWWAIDVLKFDAEFLGILTLVARVSSLLILFLVGKFLLKGEVKKTLLTVTILAFLLSLPELGVFYNYISPEYAKLAFLGTTALDAPLTSISMVILGILIARFAPRSGRATYMAVSASFMNLALMYSDFISKRLNEVFIVSRGEYSQYGKLLASTIVLGTILSIIGIILVRKKKSTPVPGYVVDKNGYLRKEMDINCVNNDENSLKSGWSE